MLEINVTVGKLWLSWQMGSLSGHPQGSQHRVKPWCVSGFELQESREKVTSPIIARALLAQLSCIPAIIILFCLLSLVPHITRIMMTRRERRNRTAKTTATAMTATKAYCLSAEVFVSPTQASDMGPGDGDALVGARCV